MFKYFIRSVEFVIPDSIDDNESNFTSELDAIDVTNQNTFYKNIFIQLQKDIKQYDLILLVDTTEVLTPIDAFGGPVREPLPNIYLEKEVRGNNTGSSASKPKKHKKRKKKKKSIKRDPKFKDSGF